MATRKRIGLAILVGGALLAVLFGVFGARLVEPEPGPLVVRSLPAYVTPQSEALVFHKGFEAWTYSTPQAVPTTHPDYQAGAYFPLGLECKQPLDAIWATGPTGCSGDTCTTSNIDWSDYDTCLSVAAGQTIMIEPGTVISRPVALMLPPPWGQGPVGGSGTYADPYNDIYVPAWLTADMAFKFTYSDGTTYYNGIRFDSDTVQDRLVQLIAEAGTRYNGNDQIVLIRLDPGESEEWFSVKCNQSHVGCNNATILQEHEKTVTCAEYRTWLTRLTDAALAAFPDKPIAIGAASNNCYDSSYNKGYEARYKFFMQDDGISPGYWASTPTPMGMSLHHLQPDSLDADEYGAGVPAGWGQLVVADKAAEAGAPLALEYRVEPVGAQGDKWEWNYWALLYAAALDADFVARTTDWYLYDSWEYWDVAWDRLGQPDDFAWVTFRDAEWQSMTWSSGTYGTTGQRGDHAVHLAVLTPTAYPQYCDSATINAAATSIANPAFATNAFTYLPCGLPRTPGPTPFKLPTPKATLQATPLPDATSQFNMLQRLRDRQARRMDIGASMGIAVDTDWTHYGSTMDVSLTLDYLDVGNGYLYVHTWRGDGVAWDSTAIAKNNTGLWQRETWDVTAAVIENGYALPGRGDVFIAVYSPDSVTYVGDLAFAVTDANTPTPSLTPSPTPTRTPTPTATTAGTATPTPTAFAELVQGCPALSITVDGTLSEWTATPVAVNGTPGAYAYAVGTPAANGGSFFCAWDADYLYIGGTLTDGSVQTAPGYLWTGDAVELAVDGRADGWSAPAWDDHTLIIGPEERVFNYGVLPVNVTVDTRTASPGWHFEAALPAALLRDPDATFTPGQQVGLVYTLINRDETFATRQVYSDLRTSYLYALRLE